MKKNLLFIVNFIICSVIYSQNLNWQRDLSDSSYLSSGTWFDQDNPATVIGSDGSVFVTTQGKIRKINPQTGSNSWDMTFDDWPIRTPIFHESSLYIPLSNGLEVLDAQTGEVVWKWIIPITITEGREGGWSDYSSCIGACLDSNHQRIVISYGNLIVCLDIVKKILLWFDQKPSGHDYWWYWRTPPVISDDCVYIGAESKLYVYDLNVGSILHRHYIDEYSKFDAELVIDKQGKIYALNDDGEMFIFHKNREIGSFFTGQGKFVLGEDDTLIINSSNWTKCFKKESGELVWETSRIRESNGTPTVGDNNIVYVGGWQRFWALNGLTGAIINQGNVAGDVEVSPTLSPQGDLYFYDSYLTLYSVGTTSKGTADTGWPTRFGNFSRINSRDKLTPIKLNINIINSQGGELIYHFEDEVPKILQSNDFLIINSGDSLYFDYNLQEGYYLRELYRTTGYNLENLGIGLNTFFYDSTVTCEFIEDHDNDADGLMASEEEGLGLNPEQTDTDLDMIPDGIEVFSNFDPLNDNSEYLHKIKNALLETDYDSGGVLEGWVWTEKNGWTWMIEDNIKYFWSYDDQDWVFFDTNKSTKPFYRFLIKSWEE